MLVKQSNFDRFTLAQKLFSFLIHVYRPFATAASHLPHARTHTHTHSYAFPDNSASFALCHLFPSSFLHTRFSLVSFPSLTFLSPSDDCGGDSCYETRRDI